MLIMAEYHSDQSALSLVDFDIVSMVIRSIMSIWRDTLINVVQIFCLMDGYTSTYKDISFTLSC